jgi:uncharacterized membrane protein YbhN (UPF0104 family)
MRNAVEGIARFLRGKMTGHRIGVAAGLTITLIASYVLYRLLHDISPSAVLEAIRNTNPLYVLLSALFVAGGYLTLTFYDYFALRTIGRPEVPYRVAAIAGFTSYSIGHNVGFTVLSGGTVRYRIYSTAAGLSVVEVAKICFVAGLTFWLGNIAVLGLGLSIDPEAASAIDHLPPLVNRILGMTALAVLAGYVIWVSLAPRTFGRGGWTLQLPAGNLTLLQILIGVIDLTCCALAMYLLMPAEPAIGFITLAVIFVSATLLGFASHTPGGIGVFDSAMLIALSQFNKEELVGALLLFRLFYYIIPFAISLVIVGFREFLFDLKPLVTAHTPVEGLAEHKRASHKTPARSKGGAKRRKSPVA